MISRRSILGRITAAMAALVIPVMTRKAKASTVPKIGDPYPSQWYWCTKVYTPANWPLGHRLLVNGNDVTDMSFHARVSSDGWGMVCCYVMGPDGLLEVVDEWAPQAGMKTVTMVGHVEIRPA